MGLLLGAGLLLLGSVRGSDDWFPFGPFLMYAGAGPTDGVVESTALHATTAAGAHVVVPESSSGMRRAELEGQLATFVARPQLLAAVADTHAQRQPREARYIGVQVVQRRYEVHDRRVVGHTDVVLAGWGAP